jgi:hypothetical protein
LVVSALFCGGGACAMAASATTSGNRVAANIGLIRFTLLTVFKYNSGGDWVIAPSGTLLAYLTLDKEIQP